MTNQANVLYAQGDQIFTQAQTWIDTCISNGTPDTHFDLLYAILDEALEESTSHELVEAAKALLEYRFDQ